MDFFFGNQRDKREDKWLYKHRGKFLTFSLCQKANTCLTQLQRNIWQSSNKNLRTRPSQFEIGTPRNFGCPLRLLQILALDDYYENRQ